MSFRRSVLPCLPGSQRQLGSNSSSSRPTSQALLSSILSVIFNYNCYNQDQTGLGSHHNFQIFWRKNQKGPTSIFFFREIYTWMNISEHIYRLHHNVHRTEQRSATLLHARIFTERRKQAAVKALVLLLQSIDLGRVHVSCAPFSESKATLGNSARRMAHAAQQTAACHPSMWWQRQCCLSQTSFIKVVTLNNGLVH